MLQTMCHVEQQDGCELSHQGQCLTSLATLQHVHRCAQAIMKHMLVRVWMSLGVVGRRWASLGIFGRLAVDKKEKRRWSNLCRDKASEVRRDDQNTEISKAAAALQSLTTLSSHE